MFPPLGYTADVCTSLTAARIDTIFRMILLYEQVPEDERVLTPGEHAVLLVADLLEEAFETSPDAQLKLLQRLHRAAKREGDAAWAVINQGAKHKTSDSLFLGMADRKFITSTSWTGYIDLHTLEEQVGLPAPPFETIVYNLSVRFLVHFEGWLKHQAEREAHENGSRPVEDQPADRDSEPASNR